MRDFASRLSRSEDGASAVEYSLLLGLIAFGIIAASMSVGDGARLPFVGVADELQRYLGPSDGGEEAP